MTTTYSPGDFSFFTDNCNVCDDVSFTKMWAQSCTDAYYVCVNENLWPFFKNFSPPPNRGYSWWGKDDPHYDEWKRVDKILSKIDTGHSGSSWACLMRVMEKIAKRGWQELLKDNLPKTPPLKKQKKNPSENIPLGILYTSGPSVRCSLHGQKNMVMIDSHDDDFEVWECKTCHACKTFWRCDNVLHLQEEDGTNSIAADTHPTAGHPS